MMPNTTFHKKKKNLSSSSSSSRSLFSLIILLKIGGLLMCIVSLMNISYQYGITVGGEKFNNYNSSNEQINAPQLPPQDQDQDQDRQQKEKEKSISISTKEQKKEIRKYIVPDIYKKEHNRIDNIGSSTMNDEKRFCKQFGVEPLKNAEGTPYYEYAKKRKIFLGSMLADESNELLLIHAIEVYNKYDNIAFVESNTTHNNKNRKLHYSPGSTNFLQITKGELFGDSNRTTVTIEYYDSELNPRSSVKNHPHLEGMNREVEQRNLILGIWMKQGMERWDVGIMSDIDEIVSREFLNALRVCDFPVLRYYGPEVEKLQRSTCQKPKMILSTIQYESSPKCIKKDRWFHPDILVGNCLLGIGDNSGRVSPTRNYNNEYGQRTSEYGKHDYQQYPKDVIENNRYPLWDGRDIRTVNGNSNGLTSYTKEYIKNQRYGRQGENTAAAYGTAYHLHNWFNDLEVLRNKYGTYGHSQPLAYKDPLSIINEELDLSVRCHRNLGNDGTIYNHTKYPDMAYENNTNANNYYINHHHPIMNDNETTGTGTGTGTGKIKIPNHNHNSRKDPKKNKEENEEYTEFGGNKPIYFINKEYVNKRILLVQQILQKDEKEYGSIYD